MEIILTEELKDAKAIDMKHYEWRAYEFPDGIVIKIVKPQWLVITEQGSHRILDNEGVCHWIPAPYNRANTGGFVHIFYKVVDGSPHFRF